MLVLARKRGESIVIGDGIRVMVVDINGSQVRLGIEAPKDVPVNRQEVHDALQRVGPQTAAGAPSLKIPNPK